MSFICVKPVHTMQFMTCSYARLVISSVPKIVVVRSFARSPFRSLPNPGDQVYHAVNGLSMMLSWLYLILPHDGVEVRSIRTLIVISEGHPESPSVY